MFFTRRGSRFGCAMAEIVFHGQGDLVEVQAALSPRLLVERSPQT
jgi:hypothetical protein